MKFPSVDISKFAGLAQAVSKIKVSVEQEKALAEQKLKRSEELKKEAEENAQNVHRELSVQLRCAGRSYQNLLAAQNTLQEQLRVEEQKRLEETQALQLQVNELKDNLDKSVAPWKIEVAKRDTRILKLQEQVVRTEVRLKETMDSLAPLRERYEKEIATLQEHKMVLTAQYEVLQKEMAAHDEEHEHAVELLKAEQRHKVNMMQLQIEDLEREPGKVAAQFEKQLKDAKEKMQALEVQLAQVDYTPYEKRLEVKEKGLEVMIRDFKTSQVASEQNVQRMRQDFDIVLQKMDRRIQEADAEMQRRLAPWPPLVKAKEAQIARLEKKIEDLQLAEADRREIDKQTIEDLMKQLKIKEENEQYMFTENTKLVKQIKRFEENAELDDETKDLVAKAEMKVTKIKSTLEMVVDKCQLQLKMKDVEIQRKLEMAQELQRRVLAQVDIADKIEHEAAQRVEAKEQGYIIVAAELKYAENQVQEERAKTAAVQKEVKKKDERIEQLMEEHEEELAVRLADREQLQQKIFELQVVAGSASAKEEALRLHWEALYEFQRNRSDERVADLRIEMEKRDRQRQNAEVKLAEVRVAYDRARMAWDDKQKEFEAIIIAKERIILGLKNEMEFMRDSAEVKYQKLQASFEKVQKRMAELLGPGGVQEVRQRCSDLKAENDHLSMQMADTKEVIKKQKRQIRDLQMQMDMQMKEMADLLQEKEKGIQKMVGDIAQLEVMLQKQAELKDIMAKEMTDEKREMVQSFGAKLEQMEQIIESMRFTDREELVAKSDAWRVAYERVCLQRDEYEDKYSGMLDVKDTQLRKLAQEHREEQIKHEVTKIEAREAIEKVIAEWKMKVEIEVLRTEEVQQQVKAAVERGNTLELDLKKALLVADHARIDPEKEAMKLELVEKDKQILAIEAGTKLLIQEVTDLERALQEEKDSHNVAAANWEPQIKWRDERYEVMVKEHENLKQILAQEMIKAQEACKAIEESVRLFPNPFEDELVELKEKYSQITAGMLKLNMENIKLKEERKDLEEEWEKKFKKLHKQLFLANHILYQIHSLGVLKDMLSEDELKEMEALGQMPTMTDSDDEH